MKNKKEIPELSEEWENYKKFLKKVSKKICDCPDCKKFRFILRGFSQQELAECLRNFIVDHSTDYQYQKYPSYLG